MYTLLDYGTSPGSIIIYKKVSFTAAWIVEIMHFLKVSRTRNCTKEIFLVRFLVPVAPGG